MCRPSLFLGEVALATAPHSVHQVVGDVDVTTRAFQGGGLENVALVQLQALLDQSL
jgi:hypothetical protein